MSNTEKVWFITGTSKGLGLSLTRLALSLGDKVAATTRNKMKRTGLPLVVNNKAIRKSW